jgi:GrpB-like predicted nucleotidyltransferase (UPF0157 family)
MLKINVVPYDPAWPLQFASIASSLSFALADFVPSSQYKIEHVGSTSIPGLSAKPIIDIDIIVPAFYIMEAVQALTSHGYTYAYEPVGIDRMVFRYNLHTLDSGASRPTEDGQPRRAVYLNKEGGAAMLNHLAVRDTLRSDDKLRDEYSKLKESLAGEMFEDIGAYGARKSQMIERILRQSGLSSDELARIMERPKRRVDGEIQAARRAERALVATLESARQGEA